MITRAIPSSRRVLCALAALFSFTLVKMHAEDVNFFDTSPRNYLVQAYYDQYGSRKTQDYFDHAVDRGLSLVKSTGAYIDGLAHMSASQEERRALAQESFKLYRNYEILYSELLNLIYAREYVLFPITPLSKPYQDSLKLALVLTWSVLQYINEFDYKLGDPSFGTLASAPKEENILWWYTYLNKAKHSAVWLDITLDLLKNRAPRVGLEINDLFKETIETEHTPWPFSYLIANRIKLANQILHFSANFYSLGQEYEK